MKRFCFIILILTFLAFSHILQPFTVRAGELNAVIPSATPVVQESVSTSNPFSINSFWNKRISPNAQFADVHDAITNGIETLDLRAGLDLVSVAYTDNAQPPVDFRLSGGWYYPDRTQPIGDTLFRKNLSNDALTDIRFPYSGNAIYVIVDSNTGRTDQGSGAWREPGSYVTTFIDAPWLHNRDIVNSNGFYGPRASNLHALGGAILSGEINQVIDHAVAISMSSMAMSRERHFVWPALGADEYAATNYSGPNINLTMGSLLAMPPDINIDNLNLQTPQGRVMAINAQEYGWYIVDNSANMFMQIAFERGAAYQDLGLVFDENPYYHLDPSKINYDAFVNDLSIIFSHIKAVANNAPDLANNSAPVITAVPDISANVGVPVTIDLDGSDADNDYVVVNIINVLKLGSIQEIDKTNYIFKYTPYFLGSEQIQVRAFDGQSYSDIRTVVVNTINRPPTIAPIGNISAVVGTPVDIDINPMDADNHHVTLDVLSSLRFGIIKTIDAANHIFRYTPRLVGSEQIQLRAFDGYDYSAPVVITINIAPRPNTAPVISAVPDISANLGVSVIIDLDISDAENDPITLEMLSALRFGILELIDATNYIFKYTPRSLGSEQIQIRAFDGQSYSNIRTVIVNTINRPPTIAPIGNISAVVGTPVLIDLNPADADKHKISLQLLNVLRFGTIELIDATNYIFRYTPRLVGSEQIQVRAFDGYDYSAPVVIAINIAPRPT